MVKVIDLEDKIDCLVAKKEPVVTAFFQPKITLSMTGGLWPQYGASREDACHKAELFLDLAKNNNASLIVFPEYSAPRELLFTLCTQPERLLPGSLVILPLEALSLDEYKHITILINNIDKCECEQLDISERLQKGFVNICSIIALTDSRVKVYFQPKRFPSQLETSGLCHGSDYFCFKGKGIALNVMLCADGNEAELYNEQIAQTINTARGCYFIHAQWNPKPRYPIYNQLWQRIISSDTSGSNLLMSVNVASGSSVEGRPDTMVEVPYVSIAFGGDGRRDTKYMSRRNLIAFKSLFEQRRYGQVMNFIFPYDCAHIAEVKRPFENPTHAANITHTLLHGSKTFCFSGEYNELDDTYAVASVRKELGERGTPIPEECFSEFTPEELEIFISSCLLHEKYAWLEHDILARPLIWLSSYRYIVRNRAAEDELDLFFQCLDRMDACEVQGYEPKMASEIRDYPINLKHKEDNSIGWLFHCRGLSADRASSEVSELLKAYVHDAVCSRLRLFPIGDCASYLRKEKIQMSSLSPLDSELLLKRSGMINDPLANLEIEIATL